MNKRRNEKTFMLTALLLSVISLTIGFAAFSTTLNINSRASVTPNASTFTIKFVNPTNSSSTSITPTTTGGATADPATISGTTLSGLNAKFTKPGQSVTYTVNIENTSPYIAYLFKVYMEEKGTCVAGSGATNSLVQSACDKINVKLELSYKNIGSESYDYYLFDQNTIIGTNESGFVCTDSIVHKIPQDGGYRTAKITITYDSTATAVDGPFDITFNPITLEYNTVHPSSECSY